MIYSAISLHITRRLGNRRRVKEIQDEMNRISAMLRKIDYSTEAGRKEAEMEQDKIPKLMSESMVLQFKPLVVTLPTFIVVSYLIRTFFPDFSIRLAVSIPVFIQNFNNFPNWRDTFGSLGWFILCLLLSGIVIQILVDRMEKGKKRK